MTVDRLFSLDAKSSKKRKGRNVATSSNSKNMRYQTSSLSPIRLKRELMYKSEESEICYLKTTTNSFNKFNIRIEGSVINFLICSDTSDELVLQLSTSIK